MITYGDTPIKAFTVLCRENSGYFALAYDPYKDHNGFYLDKPFFASCQNFEGVCSALEKKGYKYSSKESVLNGQTIFRWDHK